MKKITIALLLFTLAFSVFGQQSTVNYTNPKPVPASKYLFNYNNNGSNVGTRSSSGSWWLSYQAALDTEIGGLKPYIAPMYSDSTVYFSYGVSNGVTQYGKAFAYGLGQEFNAWSSFFSLAYGAYGFNLPTTEDYTLDSVSVAAGYSRLDPDTGVVDTLLIDLIQGAYKSNAFPDAYFTSTPDTYWVNHFNADTVFFPILFYYPSSFGLGEWYYGNAKVNVKITTIKVPLHQADTAVQDPHL